MDMWLLRLKKGLGLALVWTVLTLVLGEMGLRVFDWADRRFLIGARIHSTMQGRWLDPATREYVSRSHKTLIYRNTPNYRTSQIHINSLGFRGDEFTPRKPERVWRIVALGDSCTFGWGLPDGDTYPARLADRLARECKKEVSVINAGVPGYSSWQTARWLQTELFGYDPDIVTVYVGWNDLFEARPGSGGDVEGRKRRAYLLRKSRLLAEIRTAFVWYRSRIEGTYHPDFYEDYRPAFFETQLTKILSEAKKRGVRVVLCSLPTAYQKGDERADPYIERDRRRFEILYERYNAVLRRMAERHEAEWLDLAGPMNGRKELFLDFCHPSARGNEVISGLLTRTLMGMERGVSPE
ncbi:MAG TPA: SGNH/GDSL hydrolase family protein [Elusimicrobiota bacterium]|nr:SGNH/GDSL hydrolase family protein [Elusimicrobiota bacterium]